MFRYAKANTALVNVYIDAPFATKIIVDEKVPTISFIAQVSISSTFYVHLFCTKVFATAFFWLHVTRKKAKQSTLYKNARIKC